MVMARTKFRSMTFKVILIIAVFTLFRKYNYKSNYPVLQIQHNHNISSKICPKRTSPYLGFTCRGRLGNMMSCFATAWGLAKAYGLTPFAPIIILEHLTKIFQGVDGVFLADDELTGCNISWTNYTVDQLIVEQESCRRSRLYGYLRPYAMNMTCKLMNQSHPNVMINRLNIKIYALHKFRREIIDRIFKFRPYLESGAQGVLKKAGEQLNATTFIGVHVRRGDYQKFRKTRYGDSLVTKDFYLNGMKWFKKKYKKCVFLVVSDDMKWCRTNFGQESEAVMVGGSSPELDLAILSACNHSLVDYGTFSTWGAYLAGKGRSTVITANFHKGPANSVAGYLGWHRGVPPF